MTLCLCNTPLRVVLWSMLISTKRLFELYSEISQELPQRHIQKAIQRFSKVLHSKSL